MLGLPTAPIPVFEAHPRASDLPATPRSRSRGRFRILQELQILAVENLVFVQVAGEGPLVPGKKRCFDFQLAPMIESLKPCKLSPATTLPELHCWQNPVQRSAVVWERILELATTSSLNLISHFDR